MMSLVDPSSCGCKFAKDCQMAIKQAEMVGFKCLYQGTQFCCNRKPRRQPGQPHQPNQYWGISENLKAMRDQLPDSVKKAISFSPYKDLLLDKEEQDKVIIKSPETAAQFSTPTSTSSIGPLEVKSENKSCSCIKSGECPVEKLDLSFGSSCGFGSERCCGNIDLSKNETKAVDDEPIIELKNEDFQEKMDAQLSPIQGSVPIANIPDLIVPMREEDDVPVKSTTTSIKTVKVTPSGSVVSQEESRHEYDRYMYELARRRHNYETMQRYRQQEKDQSITGQIDRFLTDLNRSFWNMFQRK